jgi:hypothetical protein
VGEYGIRAATVETTRPRSANLSSASWLRSHARRRVLVSAALVALACLMGASVPVVPPLLLAAAVGAAVIVCSVALYPSLAAYLLLGVTPLVAGIDRGTVIPVLRPNEALAVLVGAGLMVRWLSQLRSGGLLWPSPTKTDLSILVVAVTSSVLPLAWMLLRGRAVESDDLLYSIMVWKYYGVFLIVRASLRTEREVYRCLWISMCVAAVVAVVAIMQSLQIGSVTGFLATHYSPYGNVQAVQNSRGGATLSLPIAVADLMTFNLGVLVGLLLRDRSQRTLLFALGGLFVAGVLSSGEFSGVIGLIVGMVALATITRRVRPVLWLAPALAAAAYLLRPVIERRLSGFHTVSGLPTSWAGRIHNLQSYFWPQLFSHGNFVLGLRPAARVATPSMATGYIWIESGYTWLLWAGGIPLLAAFLYFVWANLRGNADLARRDAGAFGAAATGVVTALVVITLLMILDPHLTFRGSADLLFGLLALTAVGQRETVMDRPAEARK